MAAAGTPNGPFVGLPPELLHNIIEAVIGYDPARIPSSERRKVWEELCELRLACKALSAAVIPFHFRNVRFSVDEADWTTITEIANEPALACHVRRIAYEPAFFLPEFSTVEEFRDALFSIYMQSYGASQADSFSKTSVEEGYQYYEEKHQAQRRLLGSNLLQDDAPDLLVLLKVLPSMPNVTEIYWRNCPAELPVGLAGAKQQSGKLSKEIINLCMSRKSAGLHEIVAVMPALIAPTPGMASSIPGSMDNLGMAFDYFSLLTFRGVQLFARARQILNLKWSALSITIKEGFPLSLQAGATPPQKKTMAPLQEVATFLMQFDDYHSDWYLREEKDAGFFKSGINGTMVSLCCPSLHRISLRFRFGYVKERPRSTTMQATHLSWYERLTRAPSFDWHIAPELLVGSATYHKLKTFELDGLIGSKESLVRFLRQHRATLRTLYITGFASYFDEVDYGNEVASTRALPDRYIDDGNWGECRDLLRRMAELDLNLTALAIWPAIPLHETRGLREMVDEMEPGGTGWQDPEGREPCYVQGALQMREFLFGVGLDIDHMDID